jgi:small ligand-binding sensory domain FIST
VPAASGGLVFVSGALANDTSSVLQVVRSEWRGIPTCIVPTAGVLTERSELEGMTAAAGLLWSGGRVSVFATAEPDWAERLREFVLSVVSAGAARPSGPPSGRTTTVVVFARQEPAVEALASIANVAPFLCLFGAGMTGDAVVSSSGWSTLEGGGVAAVVLRDGVAPIVGTSNACRLLGPPRIVEEVSEGMVLRIDGQPALDFLSSCANEGGGGLQNKLVLAAIDDGGDASDGDHAIVVRPVRGIDPTRRGIVVNHGIKPGMRMTFAVRDPAVSRGGLEMVARTLSQHALGSAPRFALYLASGGRGQSLYGTADVETRVLRQRFGDLPVLGMRSTFEIFPGPHGSVCLTELSGVLSLFRFPS